jgi:hypothetical protein
MNARSAAMMLLCACIAGCANSPIVPAGQSFADGRLQSDALQTIKHIEYGMPRVTLARVVEAPSLDRTQPWKEIWTIERRGGTVDYAITFTPRRDIGGTDMRVSPLNMPAPRR